MPLITVDRATDLVPNFDSTDKTVMASCVNAASGVIEKYCNRTFASTSYDELYDGTGDKNLLLDQFPTQTITQVMFNPMPVMQIRNTDSGVQRASFRIDGDTSTPPVPNKMYLVSVKSGITTTRTITLSTTVTLADLATAINAYSADGWAATALGTFTTWATADLYPLQPAKDCKWFGNAYLMLHVWNLPEYLYRAETGELISQMGFALGNANFRVKYTAGFCVVPEAIQQACAALAVGTYLARGINPNLTSESLGSYSYSVAAERSFKQLDIVSKFGISLYRNLRAQRFKVY